MKGKVIHDIARIANSDHAENDPLLMFSSDATKLCSGE